MHTRKATMQLNPLTCEQSRVLNDLHAGHNVVVRAGPGMGKSTLGLHVAHAFQDRSTLLFSYNRRLRDDTNVRARQLGIHNLEVHTYHSFSRKYFNRSCQDNNGVREGLRRSLLRPLSFDVLILDEQQDMTPLYAELMIKVLASNECDREPQLLVLGDERQSIYDFNAADPRFLTLARVVFAEAAPSREWRERRLTITHRLTRSMSATINSLFLNGEPRFRSEHNGPPVRMWLGDAFDARALAGEVERWVRDGHAFQDIMIVAPSVRTSSARSPIARLENRLVELGFPVAVTNSDEGPIMSDVVSGKILFASYHQTKGTERDCVMVLGLDNSYFKYYNTTADCMACPNPVFVAVTRARKELTLVVHRPSGFLPFVDEDVVRRNAGVHWELVETVSAEGDASLPPPPPPTAASVCSRRWTVSDLVRHVPEEVVESVLSALNWETLAPLTSGPRVDLPTTVTCGNGLTEQVADLVGIAIPALHELRSTGRCGVMDFMLTELSCRAHDEFVGIIDCALNMRGGNTNMHDMLVVTAHYHAHTTGLIHRISQLDSYDWFPAEVEGILMENMDRLAPRDNKFVCEKQLARSINGTIVTGRADLIDECGRVLYEIKCVQSLQPEHMLQVAVYAFLHSNPGFRYVLVNVASGEQVELRYDESALQSMMVTLIEQKSRHSPAVSDVAFLHGVQTLWHRHYTPTPPRPQLRRPRSPAEEPALPQPQHRRAR